MTPFCGQWLVTGVVCHWLYQMSEREREREMVMSSDYSGTIMGILDNRLFVLMLTLL